MARNRRRRRNSGFLNFVGDIFDDVKDFIDDEILDRGRDTERDLRRATRNWTDEDYGRGRYGRDHHDRNHDVRDRRRSRRRHHRGDDDLIELRAAIEAITVKIGEITESPKTTSRPKSTAAA